MKKMFLKSLLILVAALSASPCWAAKKINTTTKLGALNLDIQVEAVDGKNQPSEAIPLNKLTRLRIVFAGAEAGQLKDLHLEAFDAQMPAHRHGMITRPVISKESDSVYLIDGVKFHMAGQWQILLKLKHKTDAQQVAMPLNL